MKWEQEAELKDTLKESEPEEADKYKYKEGLKGNPMEDAKLLANRWKTWCVDYNEILIGLWDINAELEGQFQDQLTGGPWK